MATKMTINDLLKWAHDETKMADALEDTMATFGTMVGLDIAETITKHRARSRWLDEQVATRLDDKEKKGNG